VLPEPKNARFAVIVAAVIAAVVVIAAGGIYAAKPRHTYSTQMSFELSPAHELGADIRAGLLESFANSGAAGTYVEYIASRAAAAGHGISITPRAVPDARVIDVTATGPIRGLVAGLRAVSGSVLTGQATLSDYWLLSVLEVPSKPTLTGVSAEVLGLVTLLLALLAAGATFVGAAQVTGTQPKR
jgi:hypothetical protein